MKDKEIEEMKRRKAEVLIKRQNDPKTKAKEFARAILECEEYENYIKNTEGINKDMEAQRLLRQFQEKQVELRWNGFDPKIMDELRELQFKINQNSTIQDFVKSQQELIDILRRTNMIISEEIGMQFAFFQGGICCG
jgi:cell fate (sporulation/competence/biofilm development) regulator YlbF (YheA/YmcA/DUF963 family)